MIDRSKFTIRARIAVRDGSEGMDRRPAAAILSASSSLPALSVDAARASASSLLRIGLTGIREDLGRCIGVTLQFLKIGLEKLHGFGVQLHVFQPAHTPAGGI